MCRLYLVCCSSIRIYFTNTVSVVVHCVHSHIYIYILPHKHIWKPSARRFLHTIFPHTTQSNEYVATVSVKFHRFVRYFSIYTNITSAYQLKSWVLCVMERVQRYNGILYWVLCDSMACVCAYVCVCVCAVNMSEWLLFTFAKHFHQAKTKCTVATSAQLL